MVIKFTVVRLWYLAFLETDLEPALALNQNIFTLAVMALLHYRRPASNFSCWVSRQYVSIFVFWF